MMSIELLSLIALWCGNPVNSTRGVIDYKSGADVSIQEVNQCRTKLRTCLEQEIKKSSWDDVHVVFTQAADVCTAQTPYPGRNL